MKTMLIGGTDGIGKQIAERFNADVYSGKHGGYDIDRQHDRLEISEDSLEYDICIVHTHVSGSDAQSRLVHRIARAWEENEKGGYIFVTGSITTYRNRNPNNDYNTIRYIAAKCQLDATVRQITLRCEVGQAKFRITNIKPGFLDTLKNRKKIIPGRGITGDEYCDIIEFLINSPKDLIFNEIIVNARRG